MGSHERKLSAQKEDLTFFANEINQDSSCSNRDATSKKSVMTAKGLASQNAINKQKDKLVALTQFRKHNCGPLNFDFLKSIDNL